MKLRSGFELLLHGVDGVFQLGDPVRLDARKAARAGGGEIRADFEQVELHLVQHRVSLARDGAEAVSLEMVQNLCRLPGCPMENHDDPASGSVVKSERPVARLVVDYYFCHVTISGPPSPPSSRLVSGKSFLKRTASRSLRPS